MATGFLEQRHGFAKKWKKNASASLPR